MVLQRQPFFWLIGINRSLFGRHTRWPGSHASRLVWHVTRGVMPPLARPKAVSHTNAPTSTLSPVALASLLCSEWRERSMAIMASFLVAQHLHERTQPRVERAWLESADSGSFRRVYVRACVRYERHAWLGATAMVIEPTAMDKPKTLWHRVQPCIVSFFVIKSMTNSKQAGAGAVLPRSSNKRRGQAVRDRKSFPP